MTNKERMTIKKDLRDIGKEVENFNEDIYDYYLNNVKKIGFTDREIGFMISDLIKKSNFYKSVNIMKIIDFLFEQFTIKCHPRFTYLYKYSIYGYDDEIFYLLLRNNVIIEKQVIVKYAETLDWYIKNWSDWPGKIKELENKLSILQQYYRKQKIEKILSSKKVKN